MALLAGDKLGPYEILNALGAGGMGEVYKARDSRLNRMVAIKVLPAERVADEGRKRRFIQEAQAASALNHPNIITIHDIASDNGRDYLVMEYVQGKTLDALIPRSGMRLGELLKIAIQIAEGLSKAHAAGIIHRDLKPSNIMVSDDGLVKVLDFGLAKLTERGPISNDDSTRTIRPETEDGTVMGTAAYMSPEQAESKLLDVRSDIFSFGAVLYEAATGQRAFPGDSQAAILAAVLNKDPKPFSEAAPGVPKEFERVVLRCLRKEPGKRQQHMTDVKVLLEELKEESASGKLAPAVEALKSPRRRWPMVTAVATLAIIAGGAGLWFSRGRDQQPPPRVIPLTTFAGNEDGASFSPDGSQVVFSWDGEKEDNWDLYVKMIGSATALRLTTDAARDTSPSWSPDGRQIAFVKRGNQTPIAGIYSISPLGGPEQKILDFNADSSAPAWSPDGKFLVVGTLGPGAGTLYLIPAQGGEPRPILVPKPGHWYRTPAFSPTAHRMGFVSCSGPALISSSFCDVSVVDLNADWLPDGQPRRQAPESPFVAGLAWTADGRALIYNAGIRVLGSSSLWRVDVAAGAEPQRLEVASGASSPSVARKGNRLAFTRSMLDSDIWRLQEGGQAGPFLVSTLFESSAQFSADGRRIAFVSSRGLEGLAIWLANADGGGVAQLTRGPESYHGSPRWSPDGRLIAFDAQSKEGRWNIKVVDSGGGQPRQLTDGPFSSTVPSWSHDGKWIYFTSDRGGRFEIWRVSPQGGAAGQITNEGGYVALESVDARTLYYTKSGGEGPLYARPLAGGEEKQVLEQVSSRGFVVFEDGIYYLVHTGLRNYEIRYYAFATAQSRIVSAFEGRLQLGLSVSPDRKTFLFSSSVSSGSDLMLIENFR